MPISPKPPTNEIGSQTGDPSGSSWASLAGGDDIERVAELQWPNSVHSYRSMLNDAQPQSLMLGLLLPIRAFRWYIDPNGATPAMVQRIHQDYNLPIGKDEAEFLRRRGQRRFSFEKHLEDALRALVYGHYAFEQVGEIGADGQWHLRKLGVRAPRTLSEIKIDDDGSLKYIKQLLGANTPEIPVNRLVWYAWDREGSNWVGRSMLRSVYRNYLVKDRVLRVGAINIERAGGVPYVQAQEGASGAQIRELDALARRFRVGEASGAALPHGAQLKFAMAAGGDGAVAYIKQQNEEMARAFLQMVNMLGQTNSGSRGLAEDFHDILRIAQFTIAKWFCDIFNEHVIEDDVEWNEGPEQEFAPLLKFDAGLQDPMMGFEELMDEDEGIQVDDPELRAAFGARHSRRKGRVHQVVFGSGHGKSAGSGSPERGITAGGAVDRQEASPLSLPSRPLRREPFDHEVRAQVDYAALDSVFETQLQQLLMEMRFQRTYQIDQLHDSITAANGDINKIARLTVEASAAGTISQRLMQVASIGADLAVEEARRQGRAIPRQSVEDLADDFLDRASATDALLASEIAQSASREAMRLTGGGLSPAEVADQTSAFLIGLSGAYMADVLSGAIQQSINAGRKLVYQRDGTAGTLYASELLDTNTCSPCRSIDGTPYESLVAAERDYPTGHYRDCEGRERCRGTVIKVYDDE